MCGIACEASRSMSGAATAQTAERNREALSPSTRRILNPPDPGDSLVEIRIGTLDEAPFNLKPEAEIWTKRRETWIAPVEGATQHDENR